MIFELEAGLKSNKKNVNDQTVRERDIVSTVVHSQTFQPFVTSSIFTVNEPKESRRAGSYGGLCSPNDAVSTLQMT